MSETKVVAVYGSGCKNCKAMHESALKAVADLGINARVDYITDIVEISAKGIMSAPALAIDGKVVSMGKVLDSNAISKLILQESEAMSDSGSSSCSCGGNCC